MCGFTGLGLNDPGASPSESMLARMTDTIAHRGPDDAGTYSGSGGTIGHRRLSIMDPSGGRQPIERVDEACAIAANGEIYNFPQLLADLANRHRFRTDSDSESALHLYRESGIDTARQLNGMFAFAIADGKDLYLARGPLGIKKTTHAC